MSERKIVIESSFNEMKYHPDRLTQEWIDYRMKVFMTYTLQSMKQQTHQGFLHVLKYDAASERELQIALSRYDRLPENIRFVRFKNEYKKAVMEYIAGSRELLLVRIDSDNMYHCRYIEQLHQYRFDKQTEALVNQNGYIYDAVNNRLAYFFAQSPSFYTLVYQTEAYLQGQRHAFRTHNDVIHLKHELLPAGNFMVLVHERNVSNVFDMRFRKESIEDQEVIDGILKEFMGAKR